MLRLLQINLPKIIVNLQKKSTLKDLCTNKIKQNQYPSLNTKVNNTKNQLPIEM